MKVNWIRLAAMLLVAVIVGAICMVLETPSWVNFLAGGLIGIGFQKTWPIFSVKK